MWIDPLNCEDVDHCSPKRQRRGTYPGETPFPCVIEHQTRSGGIPRTFSDDKHGTASGVAYPEGSKSQHAGNGQKRQMSQRSNRKTSEQPSRSIRVSRDVARNLPGAEDTNLQ